MTIDRIAPTVRPERPVAGTQRWEELLFVHWTFPIEAVRPLVPEALNLDPWEGMMHVGVVPFLMRAIRPSWIPKRAGLNFYETNLRTYVCHRGIPGVYFFSLEASSHLAVRAARIGWSLPYHYAEMNRERAEDHIHYTSRRSSGDASLDVDYTIGEALGPSSPGTLEHFLLERYVLFSMRRGAVYEGRVHHSPYPAQRVSIAAIEETLLAAAGLPSHGAPSIAHYASAVDVEVFGPWPSV